MKRNLISASLFLLALTACGGGDEGATSDDSQSSSPTVAATAAPPATTSASPDAPEQVDDAEKMADLLEAAVPEISDRVTITEDNDSNDLIGRPNQYDQGVFLFDSRLDCDGPSYNELDTACGAKIERWGSQEDAQARADDIQSKLKEFGLGAEYDYVVGRLLVRVSADLKPSQAAAYEAAIS